MKLARRKFMPLFTVMIALSAAPTTAGVTGLNPLYISA
jgi:hypothetical protein